MKATLILNEQYLGKDGKYPVVLRVHSRRERAYIETGVRLTREQWDPIRRRVNMKHSRHVMHNRVLADLDARAEAAILRDRKLTIAGLRRALSAPDGLRGTFTDIAREVLSSDPPKAWHTNKSWLTILAKLDRYCPAIDLADVSPVILKKYMAGCKKSGNSEATAAKDVRQIRTIYRRVCKAVGEAPAHVLDGVKLKEDTQAVRYVPRDRIGDVLRYDPLPSEQLAFDVWCLSFALCGMRWMDLVLLRWEHLPDGWLKLPSQHKTELPKNVKLTGRAKVILERYKGGKYVLKVCGDRATTPEQAGQKLVGINEALRGIGRKLGLPVVLTSHTARHTWVEYALSERMPLPDIMRQLGVKSMKAFQRYIAGFNREVSVNVADQMDRDFA